MSSFRGASKTSIGHWIKAAFIAFLVFIVVIFCLELTDRIVFRPKGIFARGVQDFEKQKNNVQIMFMGQSDMQYGIIPDILNYNAYNFAASNETLLETYYKLKYYIDDMPNLRLVVLPVSLPSFSSSITLRMDI
jgi:hypothetical protein